MFRNLIVILLITALAGQTFQTGFILLNYQLNKSTFIKNCVNKERLMLHCNGKCQLAQKIKQEERKEQERSEQKQEVNSQVISSESFFVHIPLWRIHDKMRHSYFFSSFILPGHISTIFHPPAQA